VLRTEMLYRGVHVLTACPGFTASNIRNRALTKDGSMQGESPRDENKMMTAEECAAHIYNATLRRKNFLVLTTTIIDDFITTCSPVSNPTTSNKEDDKDERKNGDAIKQHSSTTAFAVSSMRFE